MNRCMNASCVVLVGLVLLGMTSGRSIARAQSVTPEGWTRQRRSGVSHAFGDALREEQMSRELDVLDP